MCTGLSNFKTFFCDGHNKEVLFKYIAKCTSALQLDDKMIVSTSDYVLSSRNHKHLITTIMQIQNCFFVYVMLCKMVMTGSWYAQQAHMSLCRCRAVGCYGYRNGFVLYPSPLSVFQSRPGSKQSTSIFYTFSRCDTNFCFSERLTNDLVKFCQINLYRWTYWPSQFSRSAVIKLFWLEIMCPKLSTKHRPMGLGVSCGSRMAEVYI